jgi:hypothetical protein
MSGSGEAVPVPIACTLSLDAIPDRCAEWQDFASTAVLEIESDPRSVRLYLGPAATTMAAAESLARREKECCAFFEFTFTADNGQPVLTVSVPDGAEPALHSFVQMLSPGTEPLS